MPLTPEFASRPQGDILCLFDVDGTLSPARLSASQQMLDTLKAVRAKAVIGFVGGSDLPKITEQLAINGQDLATEWDYQFAENGLTAKKLNEVLPSQNFISWLGEDKYKQIVRFVLHKIADLDIPIKRGTFIEFCNGMINVSPIGRNASHQERCDFEEYDKTHKVRANLIEQLRAEFADFGLTYSIGGQISFDVFPDGWNKTFALTHVQAESFKEIHFFGDKMEPGGNDHELGKFPGIIAHPVTSPDDTRQILTEMFGL